MFYRAAIIKIDRNARSVTLREMTKEQVEEMLPRIKSFLFPDEDSSGYRHWIWENKIDSYVSGIKIPEFTVNVYRPVEKKKVEGFEDFEDDDWDVMEDGSGWYEEIVEANSVEEAREKLLSKECLYEGVGYDECHIYINEAPIATLLEEAKQSLINRVENAYIDVKLPELTVREYSQLHKDAEKSGKLQYEAIKYMRMVLSHSTVLRKNGIDFEKMSAQEYIDFITKAPLLTEDPEAWNKKLDEIKAKYGKETND
jgi:hypothetical protein